MVEKRKLRRKRRNKVAKQIDDLEVRVREMLDEDDEHDGKDFHYIRKLVSPLVLCGNEDETILRTYNIRTGEMRQEYEQRQSTKRGKKFMRTEQFFNKEQAYKPQ